MLGQGVPCKSVTLNVRSEARSRQQSGRPLRHARNGEGNDASARACDNADSALPAWRSGC